MSGLSLSLSPSLSLSRSISLSLSLFFSLSLSFNFTWLERRIYYHADSRVVAAVEKMFFTEEFIATFLIPLTHAENMVISLCAYISCGSCQRHGLSNTCLWIGAVYTYEFTYESAYDSMYDLVPNLVPKVECNRVWH
jgi:hypothetical protein